MESKERDWVWSGGKALIPTNWVYLNRKGVPWRFDVKEKKEAKCRNKSGREKIGLQKSEDRQVQLFIMAQLTKETELHFVNMRKHSD